MKNYFFFSAPKPSLSKELMQKLRSMTETIKMLSDENAQLRTQNEEILRSKSDKRKSNNGNSLYDDLDKTQLVDLVMSYDEKLKVRFIVKLLFRHFECMIKHFQFFLGLKYRSIRTPKEIESS